jgi:hypothetical protein
MPRVLFTISYEIHPEKRGEYLSFAGNLRNHLAKTRGIDYSIFENKVKKNSFTEVFSCRSLEEFDQLEDNSDETTQHLLEQLEGFLLHGTMKYTTLVEAETNGHA